MLSRDKRLNLKTSFRWVASGKAFSTQNFKFFYRLGENENPKIGVSIRSAEFKKSNLRNKAKRICFNLISPLYPELPKNLNLVIMPKAQVLTLDLQTLEKEVQNAVSSFKTN